MERQNNKGQVIVELLVAFGLAGVLLPALLTGLIASQNGKVQQEQRIVAVGLLREGEEAVRSVREADWAYIAALDSTKTYHPVAGATSWSLQLNSETIGDFTRSIKVSDVSPTDPSLRKITVTVHWSSILPTDATSTFFLSRWKNLTSDLIASGTLINQGNGDWCTPSLTLGSVDLGNATAKSISAIQGRIATGTGGAAAGYTFANVDLTDPPAPATPSGTTTVYNGPDKTNDVFTLQNYAFIATDSHTKDIDIINLGSTSGGQYVEAGFFNSPNNGSANAGTVVANPTVGYMTIGNMLYDFSLSGLPNALVSRTAVHPAGLQLPAPATKMVILGNRLYISTSGTTYQLVVVDATTLTFISKPTLTPGKIHVNGLGGKSVYVDPLTGTRAYLATANSATLKEMFIINTDETSAGYGQTVGSYDTGAMNPTGIVLVNLPIVVIVGTGGEQYQVVRVDNEASPVRCNPSGLNTGDLNGIATVFTAAQRAYSYIITDANNNQVKIIEGGPGGSGTGGGVTVESPILDAGHTSTFNRISITSLTPEGITAIYQVAVSTDCLTFNYTGSYTSAGGPIPLSINPGRCFRYKVTFSGGSGVGTVASTTVKVNYSP